MSSLLVFNNVPLKIEESTPSQELRLVPVNFSMAQTVLRAGRRWRHEGGLVDRYVLAPVIVPITALFSSVIDILVHSMGLGLKLTLLPLKGTVKLLSSKFASEPFMKGVTTKSIATHSWMILGSFVTFGLSPLALIDPDIVLDTLKEGSWDQETISKKMGLGKYAVSDQTKCDKHYLLKLLCDNKKKVIFITLNVVGLVLKGYYEYTKWKNDGEIGIDVDGDGDIDKISLPVKIFEFLKTSGFAKIIGLGYLT